MSDMEIKCLRCINLFQLIVFIESAKPGGMHLFMSVAKTLSGVLFLCPFVGIAQQTFTNSSGYSYSVKSDTSAGPPIHYLIMEAKDSHTKSKSPSPELAVDRYIVRFTSDPQFRKRGASNRNGSDAEKQHQLFDADFASLDRKVNSSLKKTGGIIHHHFKRVFNGAAISASPAMVEEVKKFSYVSAVMEDREAKTTDDVTNQIINADKIWSQFSTTGVGVKIGIIDTGIDYNHEALGGGFGSGFKVTGGYDFVNDDTDPMDDFGHGTHVAGIVAANGAGLRGVAPGATLVAYKVLNQYGYGLYSWIIAAIEASVDPDQNPATNDQLDVVNMSLGGQPIENDPLVEAVNNAVQAGVIFCIAAGNDGYSGNMTIGSPGIAEKAITVGATDSYDFIAPFSSKGPTLSFQLKPDVVAPGVDVNSSVVGGRYQKMSGTSMATPQVTGAVALLKSLHSDWSPDVMKGVLMQTAKNLGQSVWDQGMGRIDVLQAAQADFSLTPGSLSLGPVDRSVSQWTREFKIQINNLSNQAQSISLQTTGDLNNPAVTAALSVTSMTMAAGESGVFDLTVSINPGLLPLIGFPNVYVGNILASSASKSASLPVTFINSNSLNLHFTGVFPDNLVVGETSSPTYFKFMSVTSPDIQLFVPEGTYDIVGMYWNHWVAKEGVSPSPSVLTFDKADAKNRLLFKPVDENGTSLGTNLSGYRGMTFLQRKNLFFTAYFVALDTMFINDVSDSYQIDYQLSDFVSPLKDKFYNPVITVAGGINQNRVLSNDPNGFLQVNYSFPRQPEMNYGLTHYMSAGYSWIYFTTWTTYPISLLRDFKYLYQKKDPSSRFLHAIERFTPGINSPDYSWETAGISVYKNDSISFHAPLSTFEFTRLKGVNPFNYTLGNSLLRWSADIISSDTMAYCNPQVFSGYFIRSLGEKEKGKVKFELLSNNAVIKRDSISNNFYQEWESRIFHPLTPGVYALRATYEDYQVRGRFGKATAELHFNTSLVDKSPPEIVDLTLNSSNGSTDQIAVGSTATVGFSITDSGCPLRGLWCWNEELPFTVNFWMRKTGDTTWISVPLDAPAFRDRAASLSNLPEGFYSIKIETTDTAGNSLMYTLEPAFLVGENPNPVPMAKPFLIQPAAQATEIPTNTLFTWSPIDEAIGYTLQLSKTNDFSLPDHEMAASTAACTFPALLDGQSDYYWRVRANYVLTTSPWSDAEKFTTSLYARGMITLVAPQDGTVDQVRDVVFTWAQSPYANVYNLQASMLEDFSSLFTDITTSDTFAIVLHIWQMQKFYWRVRGLGDSYLFDWPASFAFTTKRMDAPLLRQPGNTMTDQALTIDFIWTDVFAAYYDFQIAKDAGFNSIFATMTVNQNETQVSGLSPSVDYYWRVNGNFNGISSDWSAPFYFRTEDVSPGNTITGLPGQPGEDGLTVFPNPTKGQLNVQYENESTYPAKIVVENLLGEEIIAVYDDSLLQGRKTVTLDLGSRNNSTMEEGIFILILSHGGNSFARKIVFKK